jgi:carbon monoxide dehydrogenase subunit G
VRGYARRADFSAFFVDTELEIVGFEPPRRLVSRSTKRIRSETTWAVEPVEGGSRVTFTGDYQLPLALRMLGDRALEELVGDQIRRSLVNLQRLLSESPPR